MAYYLQMDGINDYFAIPSLLFDQLELDMVSHYSGTGNKYYVDARPNSLYVFTSSTEDSWGNVSSLYVDGVAKTKAAGVINIPREQRVKVLINAPDATDDPVFFAYNNKTQNFLAADVYAVKLWLNGTLICHLDMTLGDQVTGTIQDQSGKGNHATLSGGTWVSDTVGPVMNDGTTSLSGLGTLSNNATRLAEGNAGQSGTGVLNTSGNLLADGIPALSGAGSLSTVATFQLDGLSNLYGIGTLQAIGNCLADSVSSLSGTGILEGIVRVPFEGITNLSSTGILEAHGHLYGWSKDGTVKTDWAVSEEVSTTWTTETTDSISF